MTPTTYTPEMRAADARIAVAMGWTGLGEYPDVIGGPVGFPPGVKPSPLTLNYIQKIPHFHADEDARRALMEWLAADDERWNRFVRAYFGHDFLTGTMSSYLLSDEEMVKEAFLATPDQVARAADAMLRGEGK